MVSAVVAVVVVSILLAGSAARLARCLQPRVAAVLFTGAGVVVAGVSTVLLAVGAWFGVARIGEVAAVGGWSARLLARTAPVSLPWSVAATVGVLGVAVSVLALWCDRFRELCEASRTVLPAGPDGVVITPQRQVDAFAIDGLRSQQRIVVTAGLLEALGDEELLEAVLAHERSHLRHHHLLFRLGVDTAARANPLLVPLRAVVDDALEAWADDDAALLTSRPTVATAVATVAVARARSATSRVRLAMAASSSSERIERLLAAPSTSRVAAVPVVALSAAAGVALWVCCRHTEGFFEALRLASR